MNMTFQALLSLIIKSKKAGKGHGNGQLFVALAETIADSGRNKNAILERMGFQYKEYPYRELDKFIHRFLKTGKNYLYDFFTFDKFEESSGNADSMKIYLSNMKNFCSEFIDEFKQEILVFTLLEIIRRDRNIDSILYGKDYIPKERFFGSYAHPKRICIDALLLGLLYYTHKNPSEEVTEDVRLLTLPERIKFSVVRWNNNDKNLDLDIELKLEETLFENAKHPYAAEEIQSAEKLFTVLKDQIFSAEIRCGDKLISEIPTDKNIFLYGSGGVGKTTFLLDFLQKNDYETIYFYFPLCKYSTILLSEIMPESCYFLMNILLKYFYQYEYQTWKLCLESEENGICIRQIHKINQLMKNNSGRLSPRYVLLLDGLNEMSSELRSAFSSELEWMVREWKNVRFIISGRTVPDYDVFSEFQQCEICGISDNDRDTVLSGLFDYKEIIGNKCFAEVLKSPLFLNLYLESQDSDKSINTRGELLDAYVMKFEKKTSYRVNVGCDEKTIQFLIQYALPFAAKSMWTLAGFLYEISRASLLEAIDEAVEFYVLNDCVYQNYIAPKRYNKNALLSSRAKADLVEILLNNTGLLLASEIQPHKLHFVHQYFRDYFAAKYILNLIDAIDTSYKDGDSRKDKAFSDTGVKNLWFGGFRWSGGDDAYRLIGEICGDYKNSVYENFSYRQTVLDRLLDIFRDESDSNVMENVVSVMSLVRDNILCGVDFSQYMLPMFLPRDIKFSNNGKNPCLFRESKAFSLYESQLQNFLNCDFREGMFISPDCKNALRSMGAIVE